MKKRASTLALPLFLLTVSISYGGSGTATAQSELSGTPEGRASKNVSLDHFDRQVAGTYFLRLVARDDPNATSARLVTLTADGNVISVDALAAKFGFTNELGAWKRTGRREVTSRVLDFDFDPVGGEPTGVTRIRLIMTFSSNFTEVRGGFFGETFAFDQNPLNPTEPPIRTFAVVFEGQRVTVGN